MPSRNWGSCKIGSSGKAGGLQLQGNRDRLYVKELHGTGPDPFQLTCIMVHTQADLPGRATSEETRGRREEAVGRCDPTQHRLHRRFNGVLVVYRLGKRSDFHMWLTRPAACPWDEVMPAPYHLQKPSPRAC
jgi:hypothetical protein